MKNPVIIKRAKTIDQHFCKERADSAKYPVCEMRAKYYENTMTPERAEIYMKTVCRERPTLVQLEVLCMLPHEPCQEYNGDFEKACESYLANFHRLPEVVYQYRTRYFFPIKEVENAS